jgi:hypothetical protein
MEQLDKLPKVTADDVTAAVKKVEDLVWCKEQRCALRNDADRSIPTSQFMHEMWCKEQRCVLY